MAIKKSRKKGWLIDIFEIINGEVKTYSNLRYEKEDFDLLDLNFENFKRYGYSYMKVRQENLKTGEVEIYKKYY